MFRNNNTSRTQTTTFTGFSNVLGSTNQTQNATSGIGSNTRTSQSGVRNNIGNDIIY